MDNNDDNVIKGDPSKDFFIDMLTRDISLTDSILDLIDNSINSLIVHNNLNVTERLLGKHPKALRQKYLISIRASNHSFEIEDNCSGISIKNAAERVFKFGPTNKETDHAGLSFYGVGMKRAFFKIGDFISVESSTAKEFFTMEIDVPKWRGNQEDWNFEFVKKGERTSAKTGTRVHIKKLHGEIAKRFALESFKTDLCNRIASTFATFLSFGIDIRVNGEKLEPMVPALGEDMVTRKVLDGKSGVLVLIYAGITPTTERRSGGWNIFCNGRMVIEADKTAITGWGDTIPQFHNKFNHLAGFVYFQSNDLNQLPWRTTKTGINNESAIFQFARSEMALIARPFINYLNKVYGDTSVEDSGLKKTMDDTRPVPIDTLKEVHFKAPSSTHTITDTIQISYKKKRSEVEKAKLLTDKPHISNKALGEYTFEYFIKAES